MIGEEHKGPGEHPAMGGGKQDRENNWGWGRISGCWTRWENRALTFPVSDDTEKIQGGCCCFPQTCRLRDEFIEPLR
jgi:hypothetical protein